MLELGGTVTLERKGAKTDGVLVGWKEGKYILLDMPDKSWSVKGQAPIVGRTVHRGVYYGFQTEPIGLFRELGITIMRYPEDIVENVFRKQERFAATVPVTVTSSPERRGEGFPAMITNISGAGVKLLCSKRVEAKNSLFLHGRFPTGGEFTGIEYVIARVTEKESQFEYGGRLEIVEDSDKKALDDFLEKLSSFHEAERIAQTSSTEKSEIAIGGSCHIQITGERYRSFFRGSIHEKFALIDIPVVNGKIAIVSYHEPCVVRFQNEGMVYGFESRVAKQYSKPVMLWVIDNPGLIESINLRKSKRLETFLPARIFSNETEYSGAIVDLSESGCQFVTETNGLVKDKPCSLTVDLPDGERIDRMKCDIRNVNICNGKVFTGLSFNDSETEKRSKINSFYHSCVEWFF